MDGQEGEYGSEGVEQATKKPKISVPISLVFAKEKCSQPLLNVLHHKDVGRISGVVRKVDSDYEESSDEEV
jgi:hypothetical protein